MKYNVNWGDGVFAVPDLAADCIKLAGGKAAKVLLYILKNKLTDIDPSAVGEAVGASAEDVEDAVSYWQQVGVLYAQGDAAAEIHTSEAVKSNSLTSVPASTVRNEHERSAKMFSPEEIAERIKSSGEVKFLFSSAEATLGRVLNYTEQRTLLWLNDYYGIAPDIILMIIDFSRQINKASIGYIEKTAVSWHEKGITTHKQASDEIIALQKYFSLEGQVKAKLGLDRTLTPTEKKFVKEWAEKGFSLELIIYSYEMTIDSIGKVKFSYMDKILSSWREKGISSVKEAKAERSVREQPRQSGSGKVSSPAGSEHSYDLGLLVEHAMKNTPKIKKAQ